MNDIIKTTLNNGQKLLSNFNNYDVQVLEISIYHSTSIILEIIDIEFKQSFFITCSYCIFYKGNTNVWANAKLELSFITDYILLEKRNIEEEVFKLEDINNSFCVKFKNLELSDSLDMNVLSLSSESNTNVEVKLDYVKQKLKQWKNSRVKIINSNKNLIQLRFDRSPLIYYDFLNLENNPINTSSEDKYLDIFCSNINFLQVDFNNSVIDIHYKVTYENNETRIYSDDGRFDLIFSHITKVIIS